MKGLKHKIFEHGVFMQIRPVRVTSELGQKILNIFGWGLILIGKFFLALALALHTKKQNFDYFGLRFAIS